MENKTVPMCKTCKYLEYYFTTKRTDDDALKQFICSHPKADEWTLGMEQSRKRNIDLVTKNSPRKCPLR